MLNTPGPTGLNVNYSHRIPTILTVILSHSGTFWSLPGAIQGGFLFFLRNVRKRCVSPLSPLLVSSAHSPLYPGSWAAFPDINQREC